MRDNFDKVFLNEYGYYELKKKPSLAERQKEFEESYYQNSMSTYNQKYTEDEKAFLRNKMEQKRRMLLSNLPEKKEYSLLDIGCGEGFVLSYFKECGFDVCGIDFSRYAIEHHNPDMLPYFYQGDCIDILQQLIDEGKQYDAVNIDSALDMMLEPDKVVGLVKNIMRPDGVLLIKVANNYSRLQQKLLEEGVLSQEYWLDDPGHPSYFNKDGLKNFMEAHGYRCVDFYGESFIDFNLFNSRTNYYENKEVGKSCWNARVKLENMMCEIDMDKTLQVFSLLGDMGFGREIVGIFKWK